MIINKSISFKEFSGEYLLLHRWLQEKHVREFWDDGDRTLEQVKNHYKNEEEIKRYLFYIDNQAAGYFQSYSVGESDVYAAWALPEKCTIGIDFFIGEPQFLNRGYALPILSTFVKGYCLGVDRLLVDPEPRNHKAIHLYTKYGFTKMGEQTVDQKLYIIMGINLGKTA